MRHCYQKELPENQPGLRSRQQASAYLIEGWAGRILSFQPSTISRLPLVRFVLPGPLEYSSAETAWRPVEEEPACPRSKPKVFLGDPEKLRWQTSLGNSNLSLLPSIGSLPAAPVRCWSRPKSFPSDPALDPKFLPLALLRGRYSSWRFRSAEG